MKNQKPTAEKAIRLYTPFMVTKKHPYLKGEFQKVKGSIYVEDEELCETEYLKCEEWDMEGYRTVGTLGTFKVTPDMFTVVTNETANGKKHYLKYFLSDEGFDILESNGLKHPGRGHVKYTLISKDSIELEIKKNQEKLNNLLELNLNLNNLIK